jgi:hypothetical protein
MKHMRMLLTFLTVACLCIACFGLDGCATSQPKGNQPSATAPATSGVGSAQNLSVQQIVKIACPPMQAASQQFAAIAGTMALTNPSYAKVQRDLLKSQPVIAAVCAANATLSFANLQNLAATALPALADIAGTVNLAPAQMQAVQAGLLAAQVALGVADVVEANIAAAKDGQQAPPPPVPSVPASASTVVAPATAAK